MINAKQSFLSQVRKRAAEELTAADMERLRLTIVNEWQNVEVGLAGDINRDFRE